MKSHVKKALAKIDSAQMFSPEGWEEVHAKCSEITKLNDDGQATDDDLATGFIDFKMIWFEDNDVTIEDMEYEEEDRIEEMLLTRWVDYLQHD